MLADNVVALEGPNPSDLALSVTFQELPYFQADGDFAIVLRQMTAS
jgi:hypothetical protein